MKSIPLQIKKLLKEVSEELNIPYKSVEDVYYHQFEFLKDCMEEGKHGEYDSFNNILLKHFGTFYASQGKIKAMTEHKLKKDNND